MSDRRHTATSTFLPIIRDDKLIIVGISDEPVIIEMKDKCEVFEAIKAYIDSQDTKNESFYYYSLTISDHDASFRYGWSLSAPPFLNDKTYIEFTAVDLACKRDCTLAIKKSASAMTALYNAFSIDILYASVAIN